MYFASLHDLFFMNGHGTYVWSAYGIGLVVIATLIAQPLLRHKKLRQQMLQHILSQQHKP